MLPAAAVAGTAAVNLPGFPGMWTPGEPIAVDELVAHGGFADADALAARVEELGLPLEQVEVSGDAGAMPMPPNHVQSRAEAVADAVAEVKRPRTKAQAEKLARERGLEFSRDDLTLAEMNAELFADVAADEAAPVTPLDEPPAEPLTDEEI